MRVEEKCVLNAFAISTRDCMIKVLMMMEFGMADVLGHERALKTLEAFWTELGDQTAGTSCLLHLTCDTASSPRCSRLVCIESRRFLVLLNMSWAFTCFNWSWQSSPSFPDLFWIFSVSRGLNANRSLTQGASLLFRLWSDKKLDQSGIYGASVA